MSFQLTQYRVEDQNLTISCSEQNFKETVIIKTIQKYFMLIQTDKAVYKPGDEVKFRVLVLDSDTKPYKFKRMNVAFIDVNGNKEDQSYIKKRNQFLIEGTYSIAEELFHGDFTISAEIDNDKNGITNKTFEVIEYVLPYFEAFGETKEFVSIDARRIELLIFAKYNFGEFVKGNATVNAKVFDSAQPDRLHLSKSFSVNNIETTRKLEIQLVDDLKVLTIFRDIIVKIEIIFEEHLTGKQAVKERKVTITKTGELLFELIKPSSKFKPGFPFNIKVNVRNRDGTFLVSSSPISLTITTYYTLSFCTTQTEKDNSVKRNDEGWQKFLNGGVLNLQLLPPSNATAISLTLSYFETTKVINILGMSANSRQYINAELPEERYVVTKFC